MSWVAVKEAPQGLASPFTLMPAILVVGGNGFIGRAVCRAALQKDWAVTSVSRSGQPTGSISVELAKVQWEKGDASEPADLNPLMKDRKYIVNCVGTLFESGPTRTYEKLNYGSIKGILEAAPSPEASLVYISAAKMDPISASILSRYYQTKLKAEEALAQWTRSHIGSRGLVMRPGLVYGWERPATVFAAVFFRIATFFTAGIFPPPVHVDVLARRIVNELDSPEPYQFKIVESKDI